MRENPKRFPESGNPGQNLQQVESARGALRNLTPRPNSRPVKSESQEWDPDMSVFESSPGDANVSLDNR